VRTNGHRHVILIFSPFVIIYSPTHSLRTINYQSFSHHLPLLKWTHTVVESPPRSFMKSCYQVKYFNDFINLTRNNRSFSLTQLDQICWHTTKQFVTFTEDSTSTSFIDSLHVQFKVKCFTSLLPTLNELKVRRPDLYNNHDWTCFNSSHMKHFDGSIRLTRCRAEETADHLWSCPVTVDKIRVIIRNTVLRIHADLRSLDKSKVSNISMDRLMQLECWSLEKSESFNFLDNMRCLIPNFLFKVLIDFGCS